MRTLLEKDSGWIWDIPQEGAFNEIKEYLNKPPVLGYLSPENKVTLSVDANSQAVLLQEEKPIAYSAKALTKTQKNIYSQLEK